LGHRLETADRTNRDVLLDQLASNRDQWQQEVAAEICRRLKIQCELIIELAPGHGDPTRTVRTRSVEVFPKDTPQQPQTLTLSVLFVRSQDTAPEPPPRTDQEWEAWVRQRVQRVYQDRITLFDHWFEKEKVEGALRSSFDAEAVRIGRHVTQLIIEPVTRPPVERDTTLQEEVIWKGRWAYPVTLSCVHG
jgi:hypothetical protein